MKYPMDGYLKVSAYDQSIGKPVIKARVQITEGSQPDKIIDEFYTDNSGQAYDITLPAPPIEYSMEPGQPQPYSLYNVKVKAQGYEDIEVKGVQVLPNEESYQDIFLQPGPGTVIEEIAIPPSTLYGTYPEKTPESEVKKLPQPTGFIVLPEPVIPEYIVVHAGIPTNAAAPNYWVPFKDYIKNVASCEIYSTWPVETIRANVYAILSLTLNRVYTEWYRNKGFNFTITNSTQFDQAFTYGRNIFAEISQVVDEIFTSYITKPNIDQPLFTQYCDGRNSQCPTWMSQWGSKDLGDQGYTAINIIKTYYGWDSYLATATQVQGVPTSFNGVPLLLGSTGNAVRTIQTQLNTISNNYPAIKKIAVDGSYGLDTQNQVAKFQSIFKLPSTGIVDKATWYKISEIFVAISKLASGL
ncbi:MAG: peptidoglycan-binding protein [Clostridiales bacterium]|jgi:hypothetical protein|nr:peptidoglycan-binding protein [Clostridiales bacterium]